MNLIDIDEELDFKNKPQNNSKKVVLAAIIASVVLLFFVIILKAAIKNKTPKELSLIINGNKINIEEGLLITKSENGPTYIAIENISKVTGYDYIEGEYSKSEKNSSNEKLKGYLKNNNQVIGYEEGSNKIFKTAPDSTMDYQYFQIKNVVLNNNNKLYIALEDLAVGCNLYYQFSEKDNAIIINGLDALSQAYQDNADLKNKGYTPLLDSLNNKKTILYNMLIVADENQSQGDNKKTYRVIDLGFNPVIVNTYSSMEFIEYTKNFIVSDKSNKYGIIDLNGETIIDLKYNSIELINNSPILYKVEQGKKFGIIDKNGKIVVPRDYDRIGIVDQTTDVETTIINDIGDEKISGLVVSKDERYGIVNIKNGEEVIPCVLENITYKESKTGEITYYALYEGRRKTLNDFIIELNTTVVDDVE